MSTVERPKLVDVSVAILAVVLFVGLLRSVFGRELSNSGAPLPLLYVILFVTNGLAAALLIKIWDGANWARIIYAIVVAYGALRSFTVLAPMLQQLSASVLLGIALLAIKSVAIVLLFLPASAPWFSHARRQA
ncbi:hypothetical protein [Arenimonas terrae]|uniref:Uncharacterized protein n=1 Tax=Arenimonas terrae TaxID=2546226 RepID=A0A5C4RNC6_9GAMM|nr:hypothetical protein [Arenimonas terrae]TNJ32632.1 hypothetical protein E1B00_15425 [Arenimonas terrae]